MSFIDKAKVTVQAGDGGSGKVSFRHEKFIDKGGPDGGDGGKGGDVVFVASRNQNTLANFRYQRELKAENGQDGGSQRKHGKNGADLEVAVPVGTVVIDEDGMIVADLVADGQRAVVAPGGGGGFGNAHFVSSVRQAPRVAEKGEAGFLLENAQLELKMIADVGLVGLPNAGKSTLLSVVSNATPEIANYPFTTIKPNLGVVAVEGAQSLLFADIPGLIEGAAEGKGLGDEFLRHVERTAVLMHLIDVYQPDIVETYTTIQRELQAYKIDLSHKPQLVVVTKIEGLDADIIEDQMAQLRTVVPEGTPIMAISAQTHVGLREVLHTARQMVDAVHEAERQAIADAADETTGLPVIRIQNDTMAWNVERLNETMFMVKGHKIEKFAARTNFDSEDGVQRLRDIMKKMGIMHALRRQGINAGDVIKIGQRGKLTY